MLNNDLYLGNFIPINSIILKKGSCNTFPENMEYCEDWVFWIKSLKNKKVLFDSNFIGSIVTIHSNNTMSNINKMKIYELKVLLSFMNRRLSIKGEIKRLIKIVKRYIEFILFSEEKRGNKLLSCIIQNKIIKKYLVKKIQEKNKKNVYY